jgi:hypothetical protein
MASYNGVYVANEYPRIAIIGDTGAGKTLSMLKIALQYQQDGMTIFSNFKLIGVDYTPITFDDIIDFPEYLHDGVILLDEGHIGVDAYNFFSKKVKDITKFTTQTRKRKLIMIYTTQVFTQVAKRLRDLTNYIIECKETVTKGVIYARIFDRSKINNGGYLKAFYIDGRPLFDKYDTDEIITN